MGKKKKDKINNIVIFTKNNNKTSNLKRFNQENVPI